jgi:hypothetical protein
MSTDPEIDAMATISATLAGLADEQARARVLRYANERFGVSAQSVPELQRTAQGQHREEKAPAALRQGSPAEPIFSEFADLFDAVSPATDMDKAVTAAYWLQCCMAQASWGGFRVNSLLKDMGHGVGNVTTALTGAQQHKPALVRQTSKSGKSRQARKTYKLTTSGVKYMREKLGMHGAVPAALADSGEDDGE